MAGIWSALVNDGVDLDRTENALFGGQPDQTISMRAALAQQAGKRWGCLLCAFLSVVVQKNHCADQLSGVPMKPLNFIRAIIALSLLAGLLTLLFFLAFEFLAVVAAQVVNAVIMAGYIHS